VRAYFRAFLTERSALDEQAILNDLDPALRQQVSKYLTPDAIRNSPLFGDLSPTILGKLNPILRPVAAMVGEVVHRKGATGTNMHVVVAGEVELRYEDEGLPADDAKEKELHEDKSVGGFRRSFRRTSRLLHLSPRKRSETMSTDSSTASSPRRTSSKHSLFGEKKATHKSHSTTENEKKKNVVEDPRRGEHPVRVSSSAEGLLSAATSKKKEEEAPTMDSSSSGRQGQSQQSQSTPATQGKAATTTTPHSDDDEAERASMASSSSSANDDEEDKKKHVVRIGPGDVFGELVALSLMARYEATAVATTPTALYEVDQVHLFEALSSMPEVVEKLRAVAVKRRKEVFESLYAEPTRKNDEPAEDGLLRTPGNGTYGGMSLPLGNCPSDVAPPGFAASVTESLTRIQQTLDQLAFRMKRIEEATADPSALRPSLTPTKDQPAARKRGGGLKEFLNVDLGAREAVLSALRRSSRAPRSRSISAGGVPPLRRQSSSTTDLRSNIMDNVPVPRQPRRHTGIHSSPRGL